jgi:hypothetical protein
MLASVYDGVYRIPPARPETESDASLVGEDSTRDRGSGRLIGRSPPARSSSRQRLPPDEIRVTPITIPHSRYRAVGATDEAYEAETEADARETFARIEAEDARLDSDD